MKIIAKRDIGEQAVYDIGLPGPHHFILENGLVASNCFNKSHAVSYSVLTYLSAYLKANYPTQFFCALMSVRSKTLSPKDWAQKAPQYIQEAKQLGVHIHPPSINGSDLSFTIQDNEIYFGFSAIRDVGKTAARCIMQARGKKPYADIFDFIQRVNLQKITTKTFVSLVKAGAFDKLGYLRDELVEKVQNIYNYVNNITDQEQRKRDIVEREKERIIRNKVVEKRNALREILKKETRELTNEELEFIHETKALRRLVSLKPTKEIEQPELQRHKKVPINIAALMEQANYIGCYVEQHPAQLINHGCSSIDSVYQGENARICGIINSVKRWTTRKSGQRMAFLEIDDSTAVAEVVIFSKTWEKIDNEAIEPGVLVRMNVKVQETEPTMKFIAESVQIYRS